MTYPKVLDEWATLALLAEGYSIARYGDGEIKLCRGASIKCQDASESLAKRLREILKSESGCLVGIPRIADLSFMTDQKKEFWGRFTAEPMTRFYVQDKLYASAFITRPDSVPSLYCNEYFTDIKKLWEGRRVILINGDNRKLDKDASIFDNCEYERWEAPPQNAWAVNDDILAKCRQQQKDTLFVLALGPTATVLAYDLAQAGYQALDMGHIGLFFARFQRGEPFDFDKRTA